MSDSVFGPGCGVCAPLIRRAMLINRVGIWRACAITPLIVARCPVHAPVARWSIRCQKTGVIMNALVGREQTLSVLAGHLDATVRGAGGCVVVEGPIGIGRTRLLTATAQKGAERGLAVVAGRAGGIDQPAPIGLLISFLRHVMPGESACDELMRPDSNPFWLVDRLGPLVDNAARRRPLLIVLDDVHQADEVSALALRGLVHSLVSSPVMWLLARRPAPAPSLTQHAIGSLIDHCAVRLHLGPLDNEAVAQLCAGVLGAEPDSSVLGWAARCGGNPWLVKSLLGALREAGAVLIVDGRASVVANSLPRGVLGAVERLLEEVPPAMRRLLALGGKRGPTFTVEEAAAVLGEPVPHLSACVEEAVRAGLMRKNGAQLTFLHEVIGEALRHDASRGPQLAAPVAAAGAPAKRPGTRPALCAPVRSQQPAGGQDTVLARAIASLGDTFEQAPRTLARALRLLTGAGRGVQASRLAGITVRPGTGAGAGEQLVLEVARGLGEAGRHDLSAAHLQQTPARQDIGEADRAALKDMLADTARGRNGAAHAGAPAHERPGTAPWHLTARHTGSGSGSGSDVRAAGTGERPLWTWMVRALVAADRCEEATALCAAIERESHRLGEALPPPLWHAQRAEVLMAAGRLDEARAQAQAALAPPGRPAGAECVAARVVLARIDLHRGDIAAAGEHLHLAGRPVANSAVGDGAVGDETGLDWALAQFQAACGRGAEAASRLIDANGPLTPHALLFSEAPTAAAMVVRLAGQTGDDARAARAARCARDIAGRNPGVASLAGGAEHAEGLLRRDTAALLRAVEHYRRAGRPLARGIALEDAAQLEQDSGNRDRAIWLLESALDLYVDCGARGDITRVQKRLRPAGESQVRAPGAERLTSGWASLTGAELRVVRAIADGRSNKAAASMLFLSPHTVDSHLRRVFSKLDINSRVKLTKLFLTHESSSPLPGAARRERHAPSR
ncbi:AAA family ATPase [Streptomyces sp. NPDC052236]|uniref:helix-turn-helix transcriptional regulator n=1 Tax=Streptomyces sp. NPDC052236 TaxID=3365686 RepID=UPI0037D7C852